MKSRQLLQSPRAGYTRNPNPSLVEWMRIVTEAEQRLSVVEELATVVSANLQRATRLRQSVLKQAFSGSL